MKNKMPYYDQLFLNSALKVHQDKEKEQEVYKEVPNCW